MTYKEPMRPTSLYECAYGCKHLFISAKIYSTVSCPNCSKSHVQLLANSVHPELKFTKLQSTTFGKTRLYANFKFDTYKKDLLLTELVKNGFTPLDVYNSEAKFANVLHELVIFNFSKQNKTSSVYIGLHENDGPLLEKFKECIKQDKINKKNELPPPPPPKIKSMKDSLGKDVVVGDWVCAWATTKLVFGKIIAIEKFKVNDWDSENSKQVGARIKKGRVILPFKTTEQIFLLTSEQSLLLALEQ